MNQLISSLIKHRLIVAIVMIVATFWGILVAPFDWELGALPRDPVPVDAIPDIGENQQIVFTPWAGRSPQDIDDQITYPLVSSLLGLPGVKAVRSYSIFGFSTIYVIFEDDIDFYWGRSRILEKLSSLPNNTLPSEVTPTLGPDATALGQVFMYTLEGRDPQGNPAGGWSLDQLRSIQDFNVRYALTAAKGVAEVASIGGFVKEYQVDVDPDHLRHMGVTLQEVMSAVRGSNLDVSAGLIELNNAEYIVRGLGYIENIDDLRKTVVTATGGVPILLEDVATINIGPAMRRGALDRDGVEAVGGIVAARYGENPLAVINAVKEQIQQVSSGLPMKVLDDGTVSQVTIIPFYDRSGLIHETLDTLDHAIMQQVMITILVVILMVFHIRGSILISSMLPLAVLLAFVGMKIAHVDANIVALSGIAIAVGTVVDMGIVIVENILKRLEDFPDQPRKDVIAKASSEVAGAVLTAGLTTIVGFLPVFALTGAEGKLFSPLAWTKTFALTGAIFLAIAVIPPLASLVLRKQQKQRPPMSKWLRHSMTGVLGAFVAILLANAWQPLGPNASIKNILFVVVIVGGFLLLFRLFRLGYRNMLTFALNFKTVMLIAPAFLVLFGITSWLGFDNVFSFLPSSVRSTRIVTTIAHAFPGTGREFMPSLDEGSFLYMPTTMPHASIDESLAVLQQLDLAIASVPEVTDVIGKIGRADTPMDPAPLSMVETIIEYSPEYEYKEDGSIVRLWRDHIQSPQDIWDEIVEVAQIVGTTSAPKLQPIETRIVMLQSGFRAPMGIKVYGPTLESIEAFALVLEKELKNAPGVRNETVFADRVVGKPYLEIDLDRNRLARHGLKVTDVQEIIEAAVGGQPVTRTVEGRERYGVRVRYQRELRDSVEALDDLMVFSPNGVHIPLSELADITYRRGPQVIKGEDGFLVAYVIFDRMPSFSEVDAIESAQATLNGAIARGDVEVPTGVKFKFSGSYENQVRAMKRLTIVIPLSLAIILILLHLQFHSLLTSIIIFAGVFVAWGGGFMLIWFYGQPWFLNFSVFGTNMAELFHVGPINMSVAVWVGFLALFGIATDDGVVMATRLKQSMRERKPTTKVEIREAIVEGGCLRIRACLMTSATTILALLPVLTATGRGADLMVPMAIPVFGGMLVALITLFVVPVLYCAIAQWQLKCNKNTFS
ncbi:MAG: efflux RND transporter permease subunit [Planctomycetes bacterium]|nr:efflux RND transporter permease subunit [Planctomycetota bacterium]